jgi:hypothetical protein
MHGSENVKECILYCWLHCWQRHVYPNNAEDVNVAFSWQLVKRHIYRSTVQRRHYCVLMTAVVTRTLHSITLYVHSIYFTFMWPCIVTNFYIIKVDVLISHIYFGMKLYMFRTVRLSIIKSLFTVHSAMVYKSVDSFRAGPGWSQSKFVKSVRLVGFINKEIPYIFRTWRDL